MSHHTRASSIAPSLRGGGLALTCLTLCLPAPLRAQEEAIPQFPAGVPVVVFPVQSATPLVDGSWPGSELSLDKTLETMDAELAFAFRETRGGEYWASPTEVIDKAAISPLIGVDPERLAYQGLLSKPQAQDQLYEPLHGQLRRIAALFDARFVIVPLRLGFEPLAPVGGEFRQASEGEELTGKAVLLVAMIDIRRSAVMWHGHIRGEPASVHSPGLLATLASRVAYLTSPQ